MAIQLTRERRLMLVIGISASFFITEIAVGFYTHSLALVADAFHYLNDLVGFIVAFAALKISQRNHHPKELSFGWQRAQLLGAFFNGVFLLSLGISIFLQSIDRFISLQRVENPKLILIIGCIGFALNVLSGVFLHEHDHGHDHEAPERTQKEIPNDNSEDLEASMPAFEPEDSLPVRILRPHIEHRHTTNLPRGKKERDLGMTGVLLHVIGDAVNNVGVIIAALVIWRTSYDGRFYADPAVSLAISFIILISSLPLVKKTGTILLQSVPFGVDPDDVKHDLESIPGIHSVHELHIWRLNQHKTLASAHVILSDDNRNDDGGDDHNESISSFMEKAAIINECFHAYGIHSTTLQPERHKVHQNLDCHHPSPSSSSSPASPHNNNNRTGDHHHHHQQHQDQDLNRREETGSGSGSGSGNESRVRSSSQTDCGDGDQSGKNKRVPLQEGPSSSSFSSSLSTNNTGNNRTNIGSSTMTTCLINCGNGCGEYTCCGKLN